MKNLLLQVLSRIFKKEPYKSSVRRFEDLHKIEWQKRGLKQ